MSLLLMSIVDDLTTTPHRKRALSLDLLLVRRGGRGKGGLSGLIPIPSLGYGPWGNGREPGRSACRVDDGRFARHCRLLNRFPSAVVTNPG